MEPAAAVAAVAAVVEPEIAVVAAVPEAYRGASSVVALPQRNRQTSCQDGIWLGTVFDS